MNAYALIVTGDQQQAKYYQQALQSAGFQVEIIFTGARAQVQLAFTTPDLILIDCNLPDMPGEVIVRQINAHRRLDNSVLFLVSTDGFTDICRGRLQTYNFAQSIDTKVLASMALSLCQFGAHL
ncbi:MAG: response regulator transcription factor [Anaerolineales bacterium]|nr:response regulator transcription factor [Anaerolineales bacterium]